MHLQNRLSLLILLSIALLGNTIAHAQRTITDMITAISWSPDNQRIALGADNGKLIIRTAQSGENPLVLVGHTDRVYGIAWNPNSTQVASVANDNTIRVWDASTGNLLHTFRYYAVYAVTWTLDGSKIITGSVEDTEFNTRIRDAITGETLLGKHYGIGPFVWSPDQTKLGILSLSQITIVDPQTYDPIVVLRRPEERPPYSNRLDFYSMAWHPNGRIIATGNNSGTVRTWDTVTGTMLLNLPTIDRAPLPGTRHLVIAVNFSSGNGTTSLAAVTADGILHIWNAETGVLVAEKNLGHRVASAAFSSDNARLALGLEDSSGVFNLVNDPFIITPTPHPTLSPTPG